MNKPKNVDEYIAQAPIEVQGMLKELRALITSTAPEAIESIGYGVAAYRYEGKPLVYFGIAKKHIGLYALPANIEAHKDELKDYVTSKGTIQLPLDQKLPVALIKKLLTARLNIIQESNVKK